MKVVGKSWRRKAVTSAGYNLLLEIPPRQYGTLSVCECPICDVDIFSSLEGSVDSRSQTNVGTAHLLP